MLTLSRREGESFFIDLGEGGAIEITISELKDRRGLCRIAINTPNLPVFRQEIAPPELTAKVKVLRAEDRARFDDKFKPKGQGFHALPPKVVEVTPDASWQVPPVIHDVGGEG
jgi:sRNA-binding carbon storage regulator CsrA